MGDVQINIESTLKQQLFSNLNEEEEMVCILVSIFQILISFRSYAKWIASDTHQRFHSTFYMFVLHKGKYKTFYKFRYQIYGQKYIRYDENGCDRCHHVIVSNF